MRARIEPSHPVDGADVDGARTLTVDELETIRGRMRALDDDALRRVVGADAEQYRRGALELAWEEVRARALVVTPEMLAASSAPAERAMKWASIFLGLTATGVVGRLYLGVLALADGDGTTAVLGIGGALVLGAMLVGMIRRRRWGLWLAFATLALEPIAALVPMDVVWVTTVLALWSLPNAIYFWKRRALYL